MTKITNILLKDYSTNKNIIWWTDDYLPLGFKETDHLTTETIGHIIPRVEKAQAEQRERTQDVAEVFTPSWVCNVQNNLVDEDWFGYPNVFNIEGNKSWTTNSEPIVFREKNWQDYVALNRMEIACGEAPYLVSPYDTVTGEPIAIADRIGILDRKLRVINENAVPEDWFTWAVVAYKSTYGFEIQGDSLYIARSNLLQTFVDNYTYFFNRKPSTDQLTIIAEIIAHNIFQMDGLTYLVPYTCKDKIVKFKNLFGEVSEKTTSCEGCQRNDINLHNGIYAKIMDWESFEMKRFIDLGEPNRINI